MSDTEARASSEKGLQNTVLVLRDYCLRAKGADCDRCACACPKDAITFTNENLPVIDNKACSRCGICFGICDAFTSPRITLADLHGRMRRIASRGDKLYITCEENIFSGLEIDSNVVVLPCLATLSPEFWTLLLCEDISVTIAADLSYCDDCERAGEIAEMLYTHAISRAQEWSGRTISYTNMIPEKQKLIDDLSSPEDVARRTLFTNLIGDVGDIATGKRSMRNSDVVQDFYAQRERSRLSAHQLDLPETPFFNEFVSAGRMSQMILPKRRLLLEAITIDSSICENITLSVVSIDETLCKNSLECSTICPTGALFPDPETGTLILDVRLCVGCEKCLQSCPNGALSMRETTACELV